MADIEALCKRLREEALHLSRQSLDRGSADAGIAANLADDAADAIEALEARALAAEKALLDFRVEVDAERDLRQHIFKLETAAHETTRTNLGASEARLREAEGLLRQADTIFEWVWPHFGGKRANEIGDLQRRIDAFLAGTGMTIAQTEGHSETGGGDR